MKNIALIAAAGALAAFAMPANAVELPAPVTAPLTSNFAQVSPLNAVSGNENAALAKRDRKSKGKRGNRRSQYDERGRYREARRINRNDRVWRDNDGRYRCRRDNGTTGLVIGAGVGALAGRTVDTNGDRTAGTLLGAVAGGLLGREIDRGSISCR